MKYLPSTVTPGLESFKRSQSRLVGHGAVESECDLSAVSITGLGISSSVYTEWFFRVSGFVGSVHAQHLV